MRNKVRTLLLLFGDIVMLTASFFIMLVIRFPNRISHDVISDHFFPFILVFGIWLLVFFIFNLYETESVKPTIPHLRIIGIASMVALATSTILFYLVPSFGITPKTNLVVFSAIFFLLFLVWRRIFYNVFSVYFRKGVAFVIEPDKNSTCIKKIVNYIEISPQSGFYVLGTYSSLEEFMTRQDNKQVDTLILSKNSLKGTDDLINIYRKVINILDSTYAYENILGKIPVDSIDEAWFLHNIQSTTTTFHKIISHLMNVVVAFIILLATSPFLLIVALFIKLNDGGPIFYSQLRVGKNSKTFKLYKFRSMVTNADKNGAEWTEKNDQRITKVGKIIRKLHVDEVPQLWNVLKGEMTLVGPRPEILSFEEKLSKEIPHYGLRHIITPGFTGWAQIKFRNARGVAESKEKFEYDLYYIKNRNIFMDFGIILRTIQIIFTH